MRMVRTALAVLAATILARAVVAQVGGSVRNDLPHPYETKRDWGELPAGVKVYGFNPQEV